jgi:hypothetical protein
VTCQCRKGARCADCMERDGLTRASGGGFVSWLVQGAFGGRGVFPFNLYRWNSDQ